MINWASGAIIGKERKSNHEPAGGSSQDANQVSAMQSLLDDNNGAVLGAHLGDR